MEGKERERKKGWEEREKKRVKEMDRQKEESAFPVNCQCHTLVSGGCFGPAGQVWFWNWKLGEFMIFRELSEFMIL